MYKIEIFDETLAFRSAAAIDDSNEIEEDYLADQAYSIAVQMIPAQKGWIVHITDDGRTVADGLICDVQQDTLYTVSLSIKPLTSLLDCQVFVDGPIADVDAWLAQQIEACYITNPDVLQRRPLAIDVLQDHPARPLQVPGDKSTVKLSDIARRALLTYSVVCHWRLDLRERLIRLNITRVETSQKLEADLDNVIARSVVLGSSYGSTNKLLLRKIRTNQDTGTKAVLGQNAYYLHADGSVDQTNANRITPVFWTLDELEECDTWDADARQKAEEALCPEQYDQCIELSYRINDTLLEPLSIPIGTNTQIAMAGNVYRSILTGRRMADNVATLIFGAVRVEITKRLKEMK